LIKDIIDVFDGEYTIDPEFTREVILDVPKTREISLIKIILEMPRTCWNTREKLVELHSIKIIYISIFLGQHGVEEL
jgi:hypothetical protein